MGETEQRTCFARELLIGLAWFEEWPRIGREVAAVQAHAALTRALDLGVGAGEPLGSAVEALATTVGRFPDLDQQELDELEARWRAVSASQP